MENGLFKKIMLLILFSFILLLIVLKIDYFFAGIKGLVVVVQPILLGLVIAFALNRPMKAIKRTLSKIVKFNLKEKILSDIALVSTYLIFLVLIFALIMFVLPQFSESIQVLYNNMDKYLSNSQEMIDSVANFLRLEELDLEQLKALISNLPETVNDLFVGVLPSVFNFASSLIGSIINIILGLIISIYVLADKEHLKEQVNKLINAYMKSKHKSNFNRIVTLSNETFSNFIVGQLTEAMILGILCFIGMLIFGFEYSTLISVLVGLTSIIPIVGAFIGLIPSVFILLIVNPAHAIGFLVFILILMQIEGNLIYPRVVGGSIGLPALWVLSALIVGGGLFGILGMIIGIPLTSIFYKLIKENVNIKLEKNMDTKVTS